MPRPFDHELRSHFESTEVPRKSRCRHCSSEILNHAGSLKRHLNEFCKEYSADSQYGNNESGSRNSRSAVITATSTTDAVLRASYGHPSSSTPGGGGGHNDLHLLSSIATASAAPSSSSSFNRQAPRKAQQQARKQQATQIRALEQQVFGLQSELQRVRRENEILRGRQAHIQHVVASWADFSGPGIGFGSGHISGMVEPNRGGGGGGGPSWGSDNNNNNRPATGTADAPGDIDNERQGDNGVDESANGSRISPLFTP